MVANDKFRPQQREGDRGGKKSAPKIQGPFLVFVFSLCVQTCDNARQTAFLGFKWLASKLIAT